MQKHGTLYAAPDERQYSAAKLVSGTTTERHVPVSSEPSHPHPSRVQLACVVVWSAWTSGRGALHQTEGSALLFGGNELLRELKRIWFYTCMDCLLHAQNIWTSLPIDALPSQQQAVSICHAFLHFTPRPHVHPTLSTKQIGHC